MIEPHCSAVSVATCLIVKCLFSLIFPSMIVRPRTDHLNGTSILPILWSSGIRIDATPKVRVGLRSPEKLIGDASVLAFQIGRASCRERVWILVVGVLW